jgi:hypothetical protein
MERAVWTASERLRSLAMLTLEEGLEVAREVAHAFTPFLKALDARGQWHHFALESGDTERALELADHIINDPRRGVEAYAIALDCELEAGGERTGGVRIEAGERGEGRGLVLVQRYVRHAGARLLETVGWPELWDEPPASRFSTVPASFARRGFSEEEWRALHEALPRAFLYVATVDGPVRPEEREAFRRALEKHLEACSPLVRLLCADALRQLDAPGAPAVSQRVDLASLRPLCERVARGLGLGEALRFQHCLLSVGRRVARASNGVPGRLGFTRPQEQRALEALAGALGLAGRGG